MPGRLRFSAAMRLSGQRAFGRVFANRQTAGNGVLVLHAGPRPEDEPRQAGVPSVRLGLSVSRRVGSAVKRHGWKRRLREAFRLAQHDLPAGFDYVVVVRGRTLPEVATLGGMLRTLSASAVRRRRTRPAATKRKEPT